MTPPAATSQPVSTVISDASIGRDRGAAAPAYDGLGRSVALVIWRREMIRFLRQPTRIAAAIGTPLILWTLMGAGFAGTFAFPMGANETIPYALYLVPGMMTLVALFTAIFSSISVIEDRNEGWLQSVLVSPAPRWSIAAGKIAGGATLAFAQAGLLLLAPPLWGNWPSVGGLALILFALALTSLMMTGVGVAFAWKSETTQGFHAVMNLVLMPMWILSGAFFPVEGASSWLATIMLFNPLTWCQLAISGSLHGDAAALPFVIATVCTAAAFVIATWVVATPQRGGR